MQDTEQVDESANLASRLKTLVERERILRSRPIDLEAIGMGKLNPDQVSELDKVAGEKQGANVDAENVPFVGLIAKHKREMGVIKADAARGTREGSAEQEMTSAMAQVTGQQDQSFWTGVGEMAADSATLMGEMVIGAGVGGAAARGTAMVGGKALQTVARNGIVRAAVGVGATSGGRQFVPRVFGDTPGAWDMASIKRVVDGGLSDEQAQALADSANQAIPELLQNDAPWWKGMLEDTLGLAVERAGGNILAKVPGIAPIFAAQGRMLQKLGGKAGSFDELLEAAAKGVAYNGPLQEVGEEIMQGMLTEGIFSDDHDPFAGLPKSLREMAQLFIVSSAPAGMGVMMNRAFSEQEVARAEKSAPLSGEVEETGEGSAPAPVKAAPQPVPSAPSGVLPGVSAEPAGDISPVEGAPTPYEADATPSPGSVPVPPSGPARRATTPPPADVDLSPQPDLAPQDAFMGPPPNMDQSHIGRQMWGSLTEVTDITSGRTVTAPEVNNAMGGILRAAGVEPVIKEGLAANVPKGAAGAYWLKERVIDVRKVNDIVTASHEVGHHLERVVFGQHDPWKDGGSAKIPDEARAELDARGRELYGKAVPSGGYLREGWAQFLSFYLTQDGHRDSPAMTKWMEETFLPAHPKVAEAIATAQDHARVWRYMGSTKRARASVVDSGSVASRAAGEAKDVVNAKGRSRAAAIIEDYFFEELGAVRRAVVQVKETTGEDIPASQDPYRILNALRGTAGARVRSMVNHGMIDIDGNKTGVRALRDVRAMIDGKEGDFAIFLYGQRAKALWEQPIAESLAEGESIAGAIASRRKGLTDPTTGEDPSTEQMLLEAGARDPGISYMDTLQLLSEYEQESFELASEVVYQWFDGVMDYVAASSPTLAAAVNKVREVDPGFYVPLMREFVALKGGGSGSSGAASGQVSKRLKGSGRRVKNPLEQLLVKATDMVQMAHERRALDAFIALGKRHEGLGGLIRRVPVDMVPGGQITVDAALREAAKRIGVDDPDAAGVIRDVRAVLGDSSDAVITMFQQANRPKTDGGAPILPVVEDGKISWYQMDPDVYEVFAAVNPARISGVTDLILGAPKRWFVQGTTGLNPAFALITNPTRDVQTLAANTSAGNPFRAVALALGSIKDSFEASLEKKSDKDSYAQLLVRSGIPIRAMLAQDTSATRVEADFLTGKNSTRRKVMDKWEMFTAILGAPEFISRIAEMKIVGKRLGWEPGQRIDADTMIQIMEAGKGVTVDFSAAGKFTRVINRYVPFFNVAFQSVRSFNRAVRRNPKVAIPRGLAFFTVPTIAYWLSVKDDDWYKEMDDKQRYSYWYLPVGDELARVPRAFEPAYTFSTTFEIALNSMFAVNPEAATEFAGRFTEGLADLGGEGLRVFAPNMVPNVAEAYLEHQSNEDSFFGSPIIPRNLEDASPEYQFDEYTSGVAKTIGKALGVSPILIEHYTESVFGTVAREGFRLSDSDIDAVEGESGLADTFFLGRIFQRGGSEGVRSRSISQVYDLAAELRTRSIDLGQQGKVETSEQRRERLWAGDATRALSLMGDIKRYTKQGDERRALLRERRELAKRILDDHAAGRFNRAGLKATKGRLKRRADKAMSSVPDDE